MLEKALIPFGGYSMVQNMRNRHPGLEQRTGAIKLHGTADGTNKVLSIFQYTKGSKTERHTYAQMGDSDVLEKTSAVPTVEAAAVFGAEVFSGTTSDVPASWSVIDDMLLFSNGSDQHQIFTGTARPVDKFIVYKGGATIPAIPEIGEDYSIEVSDGVSTTVAILDSLSTLAAFDAVFIGVPVPIDTLTWAFGTTKPNTTASVAQIHYWNGSWTAVGGFTDNTADGTPATLATAGTMTFTLATDSVPHYQFGECMFWYRVSLASGALDAETEISAVTFETDWQDIQNVWDGVPIDVIEAQYFDASLSDAGAYKRFAASTIEIDSATASDKFYFACAHPIVGFYADVGEKPNTTNTTTIDAVYSWDGDSWVSASAVSDGTNGLAASGWVTFTKPTTVHPTQFNQTKYKAYWYYFTVDTTLNDDVIIGLQYMPYFDINDMGRVGFCNTTWKNRATLTFTQAPHYLYFSALGQPMVLNGLDFAFQVAGDGRQNPIRAIKNYHNEIMTWQEERGTEGGCWTMFQGKSPATLGKRLLHDKIGTMNAKTAVIVSGVLTSTATDEKVKTLGYTLSHYGVFASDGITVWSVSDDIRNYFDPTDTTNCIRKGYEDEHWMTHDTTYNVLRFGLVTGSSATVPNTFLVYDLVTRTWGFDSLGQALSCATEVEAGTGNLPIIQMGGGTDDGLIYQLNTTTNDVSTAITSYAQVEFSHQNLMMFLTELMLRMKVQSAGSVTVEIFSDGVSQTSFTLLMTAAVTNDLSRRHRVGMNQVSDHISLKFSNAVASQSLYLLDMNLAIGIDGEK